MIIAWFQICDIQKTIPYREYSIMPMIKRTKTRYLLLRCIRTKNKVEFEFSLNNRLDLNKGPSINLTRSPRETANSYISK